MTRKLQPPLIPLKIEDFDFDGRWGSQGATIEQVGHNHFKIMLSHAPEHTDWANMVQFTITSNARGNDLRLDVDFLGGFTMPYGQETHPREFLGKPGAFT